MVKADEEFPCDLVLLSSEDPEGNCHVTTANLDGETNLKVLLAVQLGETVLYCSCVCLNNTWELLVHIK
jgi:magnesium-transporting ATPase (P-type)